MGEQVKLIVMTAFLTVLVWLAADQLLTEPAVLQVQLRPSAPAGATFVVAPIGGSPEIYRIGVTGPRRMIDRLRETDPLTVTIPVGAEDIGVGQVRVIDALARHRGSLAGLNIVSVTPEHIRFIADRETTLSVPIAVEAGSLDYDVEPSVEPTQVTATLSELALEQITQQKRKVILRADAHLRGKPKGVLLDFEVPLDARIDGVEARISPSQVRLRATLREQRATATIPAVPIRFEGGVDLLNEFRIELRDPGALLTQSVTVKGPPDAIARLAAGDLKITGVIALTRGDALDSTQFRFEKPIFRLPPAVELDDPESIAGVEFRLVRNRTPAP